VPSPCQDGEVAFAEAWACATSSQAAGNARHDLCHRLASKAFTTMSMASSWTMAAGVGQPGADYLPLSAVGPVCHGRMTPATCDPPLGAAAPRPDVVQQSAVARSCLTGCATWSQQDFRTYFQYQNLMYMTALLSDRSQAAVGTGGRRADLRRWRCAPATFPSKSRSEPQIFPCPTMRRRGGTADSVPQHRRHRAGRFDHSNLVDMATGYCCT